MSCRSSSRAFILSLKRYSEADKIALELDDKELAVITHLSLAELDVLNGNFEEGIDKRKEVIGWEKKGAKIADKKLFIQNRLSLANLYLLQNKRQTTKKILCEVIKQLGDIKDEKIEQTFEPIGFKLAHRTITKEENSNLKIAAALETKVNAETKEPLTQLNQNSDPPKPDVK